MIRKLHDIGISSDAVYISSIVSVGLAITTWLSSRKLETAGVDRADRWGIFIGLWPPTLMALGNALRIEEVHATDRVHTLAEGMANRSRATVGSTRITTRHNRH